MKHRMQLVAMVLLALVVATAATAQLTPRATGMGGAVIGVADDAGAWADNPAGLSGVAFSGSGGWDGIFTAAYGKDRQVDTKDWTATSAVKFNPESRWTFGFGYLDVENNFSLGGGGVAYRHDDRLSLGANIYRWDPDFLGARKETMFDLGLMYSMPLTNRPPLKLGLVVRDAGEKRSRAMWDFGFSWVVNARWMLAADVIDITNEMGQGPYLDAGAEYCFRNSSDSRFRIGMWDNGNDPDLTLGVGRKFGSVTVDAAWVGQTGGDYWTVGGTIGF
jgi:hypothetical protein